MKSIYIIIGALLIGFSYLGNSAIIASAQETETNVRTNLKYIEGSPNDTHVIYTYDENGQHYKVVDNANSDYSEVKSQIYVLASDGKYSLIENSSLIRENENNNMEFSVKKTNGNSYVENLPIETNSVKNNISLPSEKMNAKSSSKSKSKPALSAWHKSLYSGNTKFRDMTIVAIKAAVIQWTISKIKSNKAQVIYAGATAVAEKYFKLKLRTGYYHVTYQWRTLKNNVCAIMAESEYVNWYKNASHTKYNGYTSSYWSEY